MDQEWANFFRKGQRLHVLGFASHMISIAYSFFFFFQRFGHVKIVLGSEPFQK